VQAKSGQRAKSAGGDAFDIRVLAFADTQARSVQGLQRIFGMDAATAQRIVDGVPGVLRRSAPADEAYSYRDALESIGATVVLEPAQGADPVPQPARRPGPPPPPPAASLGRFEPEPAVRNLMELSEPPLPVPRPVKRAPSADLEYDVLALDDEPEEEIAAALRSLGEPEPSANDVDPLEAGEANRKALRAMRREEIELDSGGAGDALDLALPAAGQRREPTGSHQREPAAREKTPTLQTEPVRAPAEAHTVRTQRNTQPKPEASGQQRGPVISRAAVVEQPAQQAAPTKSLALVQLLAALLVISLGVWLDNSVLYGNASLFSVIAHGLAIHQFGLGVRGLFR
jgi:hypothetical protein